MRRWGSSPTTWIEPLRFRLIPEPRVSVPELECGLVLLGIVLFQPEQLVDHGYSLLYDVLHLGLRYVRVFRFSGQVGHSFPA